MSSPLLKFQQQDGAEEPANTTIVAAAFDACPQPLAIAQNGRLIYRNRTFAEFSSSADQSLSPAVRARFGLQQTNFTVEGRIFSLFTSLEGPVSDSQHLALIGRLVGGVAHDFNNLLTGILLYCDLMQGKVAPSDALGNKIQEIRAVAEQGAGLIRQLMTVGREEQHAPYSVAFKAAVTEMAPLLRRLIGENIRINIELGEEQGWVGITLAQAQQIVLNLVLNARDAMPSGGQVWITTSSRIFESTGPGNRIFELTVKDSGSGMDAQTASRIFEPFFTTKPPGQGTGMGLTTIRKIVEGAGGIIEVDSVRGKGTQITVRLPEVKKSEPRDPIHPETDSISPEINRGV